MKSWIILFSFFLLIPSVTFASKELSRGIRFIQQDNYSDATRVLYPISRNSRYRKERGKISYQLGRAFEGLGANQAAIFQYINAVKSEDRSILPLALKSLSDLAFKIGDEQGLNYALSKIRVKKFPKSERPLLYFRFGRAFLEAGAFRKAAKAFAKIPRSNALYSKARYFAGLAFAESGRLKSSYRAFTQSSNARADNGIADSQRVASLMGRARVLYQMKRFEDSLEAYRLIPRDTKYFHDMLFESSWAMLRAGKFRSALSNFQSLHSQYYDTYFFPEATLLRGILYLYICRYGEVKKVTDIYNKTYGSIYRKLTKYLKSGTSSENDLLAYEKSLENTAKKSKGIEKYGIPHLILRHLSRLSEVQKIYEYIENIRRERNQISQSYKSWLKTPAGNYARKALKQREKATRERLGKAIRTKLVEIRKTLVAFEDQKDLLEFELISSEKEIARKDLEGKLDKKERVDSYANRVFYIKNGYEYYPFKGEYWLDEIGNYHYLGVSRCE